MPRRMYKGNAPATTLNGAINSTTSTIVVANAAGYPDGSAGNFWIVIDRGLSTEEKVLCNNTTGNTITAVDRTNSANRDDTSNFSHSNGAAVEHCYTANDANDANRHTFVTTDDDHTQYHTATRHAAVSHTTAMIGNDQITTAKIADANISTAKIGNSQVTGVKIANATITLDKLATDAWTGFTPTLVQPSAVTKTVIRADYQRTGRLITATVDLTVTGSGSGGSSVRIGYPVQPSTDQVILGMGYIYDASAAIYYVGMAVLDAVAGNIGIIAHNSGNYLGIAGGFTAGLAVDDAVGYVVTYEASS